VLGRLVEVLRNQCYTEVMLERLASPLGLQTVSPRADEAILHRAAVGHVRSNGVWEPAGTWAAGFAWMPAGSMLAMSAGDLLGFARMHLQGGGKQLSEESVQAMRVPQVDVPPTGEADARWGLGWMIVDWPGGTLIGHDGGTIGQSAYLRIAPEHDVAVVLLTNGGQPDELFRALYGHVFQELAGIHAPAKPEPPEHPEPVDPHRYVGRYESQATRIDIETDQDGNLWRVSRAQGELAAMLGRPAPERDRIVRLDGDTFITADGRPETFAFVGDDGQGRAAYLHAGQARPRVS
jgi:hypothetical protein